MKRPMSLKEPSDLPFSLRPSMPGSDNHATPDGKKQQGLIHLLENNTFNEFLEKIDDGDLSEASDDNPTTEDSEYSGDDRSILKGMMVTGKDVTTFLTKGRLPEDRSRRSEVSNVVLRLNEPKLHLALLKLGNFDFSPTIAESIQVLLDAANLALTTIFQDIFLKLDLAHFDKDAVTDKLVSLIELDRGFNGLTLIRNFSSTRDLDERHLKMLFDALSKTTKPKVSIIGIFPMPDNYLRHLLHLMSACRTVHTFRLGCLVHKAWTSDEKDVYQMLLQRLKQQTRLEILHVAATTAWEHELIGDFVESNHSIKRLSIDMLDPFSAPSLLRGLKNNRSLETLHFYVQNSFYSARATKEHSLVPLFTIFENNRCSASELILDFHDWYADGIVAFVNIENEFKKGQTLIESLLTGNTTLNSLTLIFPENFRVDLLPLGRGIKHNRTLEKLTIRFQSGQGSFSSNEPNINPDTIPAFLNNIAKNTTVSNLIVEGISGTHSKDEETLKHIISRNTRFQKYACSSSYLRGAISGFLITKGIPSDVTQSLEEYLDDQHPLAVTKALAGVNRASNEWAHEVRRSESANQVKQVLETPPTDPETGVKNMVILLGMIVTRKQDFANDVIARIKQSVFLADALVDWLSKDPSTFKILAKRLNEAGGMQISRKQVVSDYVRGHKELPDIHRRLRLLEKKFSPDQSHLASFMNEQIDCKSIESRELQAFVGYDFVDPVSDFNAVLKWCVANAKAELYVAYMANYPDRWLSTKGVPPEFRQRFLSSLASSGQVKLLQIDGFGVRGDAAIVESLLSDRSLEYLTLSNADCMETDLNLVANQLASNTRLKQLEIDFYPISTRYPLEEKIRKLLQANQVLERLVLRVPIVHPEYALLEELASAESRFQLHSSEFDFENDHGDG